MPEFGVKAQEKLKNSSVLIIGAGGLGCPLSMYLAAAGVGHIGIVDFDVVDFSNLHRQVLYTENDVGQPKAEVAKMRIQQINPNVKVTTFNVPFKSYNAMEIATPFDILIDGTDNFPTRYLVNDVCVLTGKTNVFGSIFRFDGQVTVFDAKEGPCYRCLYPDPPPPGMVPSCAEGGVLGILPGNVGVMQATEAIKILTGIGKPLIGRLLIFDSLDMKFREMKIKKDPNCPICGKNATIKKLIDYEEFCGVKVEGDYIKDEEKNFEITADALNKEMQKNKNIFLLDVRTAPELEICLIEGSHTIPLNELIYKMNEVPLDKEIITICHHGTRSMKALMTLRENGFKKIRSLRGGVESWALQVDETMARY